MIKVLGYSLSLHLVDANDTRLQRSMGRMSPGGQWMVVERSLTQEQILSTILHEILEFGDSQLGLSMGEEKIRGMETTLFSALRDNGVDLSPLLGGVDQE